MSFWECPTCGGISGVTACCSDGAQPAEPVKAPSDDEAVLAHLHLVREYGSARFDEAFNATDPNTPAIAQQWAVKAKHAFREIEASARALLARYGQPAQQAVPMLARARAEWHEDDGPVMWWAWCGHEWAGEPAWCGTPLDDSWPGYHTHWTPHPSMPAAPLDRAARQGEGGAA